MTSRSSEPPNRPTRATGEDQAGHAAGRAGVGFAASAYAIWGAVPIYFKALDHVSAAEIVVHRVLWSSLLVALLLLVLRRFVGLRGLLRAPRTLATLAVTTALITGNWLIFVWAVNANRVLEASLGYFINPLVNVLLGYVFLGERLRRAQRIAVGLAAVGVAYQVWDVGRTPWVPLALALTFGVYGLLRKRLGFDALNGLFVETLLAAPFALGYFLWLAGRGGAAFGHADGYTDLMLVLAGPITAVPLMLFAAGAHRLSMASLGFLQYIAPTMAFGLAVFVYGEPFGPSQLVTFGFIWLGLALYSADLLQRAGSL